MKLSDEIKASFDSVCPDSDKLMEIAKRKKKSNFNFKAALCACLALCLCFGALAATGIFNTRTPFLPNELLPPVVSGDYDSIYNYLSSPYQGVEYKYMDFFTGGLKGENSSNGDFIVDEDISTPSNTVSGVPQTPADRYPTTDAPSSDEAEGDKEHSDTNLQYDSVDEADIVKTDGDYIFLLRRSCLYIINTSKDSEPIEKYSLGKSKTDGLKIEKNVPFDMYLFDGKLYVLENCYSCTYTLDGVDPKEIEKHNKLEAEYKAQYDSIEEPKIPLSQYLYEMGLCNEMGLAWYYRISEQSQSVSLKVIDVSDPHNPKQIHCAGITGSLVSSRMKDGYIYIVTSQSFANMDKASPESFVPVYNDGEMLNTVEADCIYLSQDHGSRSYINLLSYDAQNTEIKDKLSILGAGSELYVSEGNIYVLDKTRVEWVDALAMELVREKFTYITRVSYNFGELALSAQGRVSGFYDDQFSFDEYNGYLRVVTNRNKDSYKVESYNALGVVGDIISNRYTEIIKYLGQSYKMTDYLSGENDNALFVLDMTLSEVSSIKNIASGEQLKSVRFDNDLCYFVTFLSVDPLFCADLSDPLNPTIKSELKIPGFSAYLQEFGDGKLMGFGYDENGYLKLSMFDVSDSSELSEIAVYSVTGEYYSAAVDNHKAILCDSDKNLIGFAGRNGYYLFKFENGAFERLAVIGICEQTDTRGLWIDDTLYCLGEREVVIFDLVKLCESYKTELESLDVKELEVK